MPGGSGRARSRPASEMALQAFAGKLEEFGCSREVPVRRRGADVAQVRREEWQPRPDVEVGPVGIEDGADGERVAQVMEPRPTAGGPASQARMTDELEKRPVHDAVPEAGSGARREERSRGDPRTGSIGAPEIAPQGGDGRRMERHQAGLAELAHPDRERPLDRIEIHPIEPDRLADAEPADREQADE